MSMQRSSLSWWFAACAVAAGLVSPLYGQQGLRRVHVGETMPEFSLADVKGATFDYRHERARVLGVVILQPGHNHLDRLVADLETLVQTLGTETTAFDCVGVMSGPGANEYLRTRNSDAQDAFRILADPDFHFWGQLGVIAAPTAVVVGADRKVQWIKAGYGYDFVAGLHGQLSKALGLGGEADGSVHVETLENTSERARRDRHIQLARVLVKKGRFESAIKELGKAREIDPNAVDVALELCEVLCRTGRNDEALKTAAAVKGRTNQEKARALLVSAWARRQMGEPAGAEALLTKALELEPESPRIWYEIGKVHDARGDFDGALACYRRALAQVFGDTESTSASQK